MTPLDPPPGVAGPPLDVEALQGLETFIASEQFLHKLEAVACEWVDVAEQQHAAAAAAAAAAAPGPQAAAAGSPPAAAAPPPHPGGSGGGGGLFGLLRRSSSPLSRARSASSQPQQPAGCELVEQQAPLQQPAQPPQQPARPPCAAGTACEPFVLVSSDDAVQAMAYYIALYLASEPAARQLDPKALQAALRSTLATMRRSRYRVVWDWGRWLYRGAAVSYSALQLYEHPWLVRALVTALWTSGRLALGCVW